MKDILQIVEREIEPVFKEIEKNAEEKNKKFKIEKSKPKNQNKKRIIWK